MDPTWGHVTIKISGHPPFGAQVILNGHEYVACAGQKAGLGFAKEGNCFTRVSEPERLAQIADTLSQPGTIGRLSQVIDRWIYTACLCFGLDIDEQQQSRFVYDYSIYQVEYSRNLVFASGAVMDRLFNTVVDRTRSRLDVPKVRTLFGSKGRPHRKPGFELSPRQAVVIERPRWNLTIFKVHFGLLTLKGYTKGERVLRFEAIVHNTKQLGCGRTLDKFAPDHHPADRDGRPVHQHARLRRCRLPARGHPRPAARTLAGRRNPDRRHRHEHTPGPCRPRRGARVGGRPGRVHRRQFTAQVRAMTGQTPDGYSTRQGAYDLRKLRGKQLVIKPGRTRRYHVPGDAARTITALLTVRDKVIAPLIAGIRTPRRGRPPKNWTKIDRDYETLRLDMQTLFNDLGISTKTAAA